MIEPGQYLTLALEAFDHLDIAQRFGGHEFQEVISPRVEMLHLVRSGVRAAGQHLQNAVLGQRATRRKRTGRLPADRYRPAGRDRVGPRCRRRGRRRCLERRGRRGGPQHHVVGAAAIRIEQHQLGGGQLIEQFLALELLLAELKCLDVHELPLGGRLDGAGIVLEGLKPQQAIVRGRLLRRRNSQPLVIGVKLRRHPVVSRSGPGFRAFRSARRQRRVCRSRLKAGAGHPNTSPGLLYCRWLPPGSPADPCRGG